jgi:hypothetical protein
MSFKPPAAGFFCQHVCSESAPLGGIERVVCGAAGSKKNANDDDDDEKGCFVAAD